ncbi:MAG: tRNA pseudouridine(38-40) synthase TruA [Rhodospirillales bacterium]|jgi:tRNA pseudouridine38-40 synthase|nr:tRNA pseudouridine(38-40) synthase TruA [Rhodospirillaceae bacterium]MDP6426696.1 tRNA pseudouridine(38-40) synthase TruA [Rhodospirillales bacterium]MDP6642489.1 tRNA pseudouridine(38-40) synthase TruA [Rhodospirillales bacterium]MDP6841431.1 tRNA pseudouridine(38-40) synthase TruA [Rhodospirillales bacterium]|tara:strand:- start:1293 stop:2030 length:738 start_codon:yes stop_codon:yes gene_type:complete
MTRYKLLIEFDGGPFVGWQRQDNGPSVQQSLEEAVTEFCGETRLVEGAGRTDAGVHALGQVAHVDIDKDTDADTVRDALNFHLRDQPITVLSSEAAADDFHARFSARGRAYLYRILDRRPPPSLDKGRVWWVPARLDADAMEEAARLLPGRHDFSTFRAVQCQADSPVKTLDALSVARAGDEIHIAARARSFLHHQVRNFAGTLKLVGEGKWTAADVADALAARDRARGGPTAPPQGLYLTEVVY